MIFKLNSSKIWLISGCCLFLLLIQVQWSAARNQTPNMNAEDQWVVYAPDAEKDNGKHIVLVSGDEEYRSEEVMPMLGQILAKHHGFKCTVLFAINPESGEIDPNNQENIPGFERIADADLVIMALRFRNLPDSAMQVLDDYLMSGRPIIGLRTSTHAFRLDGDSKFKHYSFNSRQWPGGFGQQVLGDTWINHHGHHKVESTKAVKNEDYQAHPIHNHIDQIWGNTDVYGIRNLGDDAKVLYHGQVLEGMEPTSKPVEGSKNDPMMPLIWLKPYQLKGGKQGMAFCTTMGSSTDYENEGLRKLTVNACHFLLGMIEQIDEDPNVDYVTEFSATMYGFNSFRKGMKPSDFQLDQ